MCALRFICEEKVVTFLLSRTDGGGSRIGHIVIQDVNANEQRSLFSDVSKAAKRKRKMFVCVRRAKRGEENF